jgi:uncharacterized phiE125 gp8 family phage protein
MILQVTTAATNLPVSISEAKSWLRVTEQDEDTDVLAVLRAAIDAAESLTSGSVVLAPTTYTMVLPTFPAGREPLYIPSVPMTSITSVAYYDGSNDAQTLTEDTDYTLLVPTHNQGFLTPVISEDWPDTADRADAVTIVYVAGYATDAAVPDRIKQAIRLLIGHFWENREAVVTGTISSEVQLSVRSLLDTASWGYMP